MARMRTVKPEYWSDEDLATATSRDARLLYVALWNQADEHGRLRGDPRFVKGQVFAYDDDLTPDIIDKLLDELASAGKVVRYRVNGSRYLFLPNLAEHQRLEPDKVPSRLPGPEMADPEPPPVPDPEPPSENRADSSERRANKSAPKRTSTGTHDETGADQGEDVRANLSAPRANESALARARLLEHVAGYREHVAGVPPTAERAALALVPDLDESAPDEPKRPPTTTGELVADWIEHCPKRPPQSTVSRIGKQIKALLAEGIDPVDVRAGIAAWHRKGADPSALPSFVNQVMNAPAALARASPTASGGHSFDAAMQRARAKEGR